MDFVAFELDLPLVGHVVVSWYGVFTAIGAHAALFFILWELPRDRIATRKQAFDLALVMGVAALAGGHLLFQLTPGSGQGWRGGLVLYGAILGGTFGCAIAARIMGKPVFAVLDALAAPGVFPPLFGRIGCLMAGCCYGAPTDLPWAITFTDPQCAAPRNVPLHPTQLYSIAALAGLFLLLRWRKRRARFRGELSMIYLGVYSVCRFVIEFFRDDSIRGLYFGGRLSFSQIIAVLCMLAALAGYWWLRRQAADPGAPRSDASGA